jgi:hypothetical protein
LVRPAPGGRSATCGPSTPASRGGNPLRVRAHVVRPSGARTSPHRSSSGIRLRGVAPPGRGPCENRAAPAGRRRGRPASAVSDRGGPGARSARVPAPRKRQARTPRPRRRPGRGAPSGVPAGTVRSAMSAALCIRRGRRARSPGPRPPTRRSSSARHPRRPRRPIPGCVVRSATFPRERRHGACIDRVSAGTSVAVLRRAVISCGRDATVCVAHSTPNLGGPDRRHPGPRPHRPTGPALPARLRPLTLEIGQPSRRSVPGIGRGRHTAVPARLRRPNEPAAGALDSHRS